MTHTTHFPQGARRALFHGLVMRFVRRQRQLLALLGAALVVTAVAGLSGQADRLLELAYSLTFFAPIAIGLTAMSGVVADDLKSGRIVLWYQQPGSLMGWYLRRYGEMMLLLCSVGVLLAAITTTMAVLWGELAPDRIILFFRTAVVCALIPAAMVFAYSAWGVQRDSVATVLTVAATTAIAISFSFDDSPRGLFMRALAFPIDAMQVITQGGGVYTVATAWAIILSHLLGWTGIGTLGLYVLPRRLAGQMTGE
jgi:hypothetical protein